MVEFMKESLVEQQDKRYVWHPFTQMQGWLENQQTVICEAKGIKLTDTEGRSYYDGVSSLWVNIHGHQRREIDEAIIAQLGKVAHSTALGLANIPASELAEQLVTLAPEGLEKVFYSDDGSTAVEVALKMSFQYWRHQGMPKKEKFVALAEELSFEDAETFQAKVQTIRENYFTQVTSTTIETVVTDEPIVEEVEANKAKPLDPRMAMYVNALKTK